MDNRRVLSVLIVAGAALLAGALSNAAELTTGMISQGATRSRAAMDAAELKLGAEVTVTLSVDAPSHAAVPLDVEYFVPNAFEVVQSDIGSANDQPGYHVFHWKGEQRSRLAWHIRLRANAPGYFKFFGNVTVTGTSGAQEAALQEEIAENIPTLRGPEVAERRRAFIKSKEGLRILKQSLAFQPSAIYVDVSRSSGRIETWDFGSLWKRFQHRFGARAEHAID